MILFALLMNQELIAWQTTYLLPQKSKIIHVGALRALSERFILQNVQSYQSLMLSQHGWCIMAVYQK